MEEKKRKFWLSRQRWCTHAGSCEFHISANENKERKIKKRHEERERKRERQRERESEKKD